MGDERAGAPDNPSPEQQQRLEAARSLLERNGELVFKLNGAMGTLGCPPLRQACLRLLTPPLRRLRCETSDDLHRHPAGLAALRRTSGGRPPSAEERALLAQAQRSLQDAASLLPPQVRGLRWYFLCAMGGLHSGLA